VNQFHAFAFHPHDIAKFPKFIGDTQSFPHDFPFVADFLSHAHTFDAAIRAVSIGKMRIVAECFSAEGLANSTGGKLLEPFRLRPRRRVPARTPAWL
jgi:hypothetical protein